MIPAPLDYFRPDSLDEALEALRAEDSLPLAGGHSLVPMLKLRLARPSLLVDVRGVLPRGITRDAAGATIGAAATWRELADADLELVSECASSIGDLQVRNHGTVGGSLAHADPSSDFAAVAVATDARLRLVSGSGEREVAATDFFAGPFTTAREHGELISEIVLGAEGGAYVAIEDPASGYPLAGAAVCVADGRCDIGLTGVAGAPLRLAGVEAVSDAVASATAEALVGVDVLDDVRADAAHRRRLAAVVAARALERALERA
jgi:aerobic carbon-monoxide dehydrogenase medium subunit